MEESVNVDFVLPSSEVAERLIYSLMLSVEGGGGRLANVNRVLITGKVLYIFEDRMINKTWPLPSELSLSIGKTNT